MCVCVCGERVCVFVRVCVCERESVVVLTNATPSLSIV